MSKKNKRSHRFTPAMMLQPRMETLLADDAFPHKEDAAIEGDLENLARNVSSQKFVKTLLHAYGAASEVVQSRLDDVLPRWLAQSGHMDALTGLTTTGALEPELRPRALAWLAAAGVDTADLESDLSLFLEAYYYDDEVLLGEKSQAYVAVFWYTSPRKKRAYGITFLLDYNPPWDGSVKDVIVAPRSASERLVGEFLDVWERGEMAPETISPERAKTIVLAALKCNHKVEIRLPRDLIHARDAFERVVLLLPDGPDTPAFTMEDFDFLAHHGKRPEEIMNFERTVGRRVRLDDGEEILIIGTDWENEDWEV